MVAEMLSEEVAEERPLYTADEFFRIAARWENDGRRLELDNGQIVEVDSSSAFESVTGAMIAFRLGNFVMPHRAGYLTGADGAFILRPNRVRFPNVGFISKNHPDILQHKHGFEFAPDLAVEIVGHNEDVFRKGREYFEAGTRCVWAVYAKDCKVYVMQREANGTIVSELFTENDMITGDPVLSDFSVQVRDLFPAE